MRRLLGFTVGIILIISLASTAEAINISSASVQNGLAAVSGGKAASNSSISWEGGIVTTANKNGGFSFSFGVVPSDCVGTLSDGVTTIDVKLANCTPVSTAIAPVPKTGQAECWSDIAIPSIPCAGTGQDGEFQKGVALPIPRFTDNNNGTITDNLTGLIWLKNATCGGVGYIIQPTAYVYVAELNSSGTMNGNNCGDTSNGGSHQTDWRLPNIRELFSLVNFGFVNPAVSNAAGTGNATISDPFSNFTASNGGSMTWWSSTSGYEKYHAYVVDFQQGLVVHQNKNGQPFGTGFSYAITVRGGS